MVKYVLFLFVAITYILDCVKYSNYGPFEIDRSAFLLLGMITIRLYFPLENLEQFECGHKRNSSGLPIIDGYVYGRLVKIRSGNEWLSPEYIKMKYSDLKGDHIISVENISRNEYIKVTGYNIDENGYKEGEVGFRSNINCFPENVLPAEQN